MGFNQSQAWEGCHAAIAVLCRRHSFVRRCVIAVRRPSRDVTSARRGEPVRLPKQPEADRHRNVQLLRTVWPFAAAGSVEQGWQAPSELARLDLAVRRTRITLRRIPPG